MLRTHDAGSLRPATPAPPSPSPAGWPAAATTAGWPSSTCATPRGVAQVVVRDEEVGRAHACATSTASRSPARSQPRPEGNANPDLPTGEIEVVADRASRCSTPSAPLPFQIDEHVDGRRGGPAQVPLPRPAPARPRPRRCGCAREVNRAARDGAATRTTSSRSRRPTLTRSTPEGARDFLVPGPAAAGLLVRAAAVARSCSSSC